MILHPSDDPALTRVRTTAPFGNLTFLSVDRAWLSALPLLRQLHTLLLRDVMTFANSEAEFFGCLHGLRVGGLIATRRSFVSVAEVLPISLRHLAYFDEPWHHVDRAEDDEAVEEECYANGEAHRSTMARLAQSLDSCTIVTSRVRLAPWSGALRDEMEQRGRNLHEVLVPTAKHVVDFDLEVWAWSVGAYDRWPTSNKSPASRLRVWRGPLLGSLGSSYRFLSKLSSKEWTQACKHQVESLFQFLQKASRNYRILRPLS